MPAKKAATPTARSARPMPTLIPGRFGPMDLYRALNQRYYWKTKDGRILEMPKMETEHLVNLAAFLLRMRHKAKAELEAAYLTGPGHGYDDEEWAWSQLLEKGPEAYLRGTPFWQALRAELLKRGVKTLPAAERELQSEEDLSRAAWNAIVAPVMLSQSAAVRARNLANRRAEG